MRALPGIAATRVARREVLKVFMASGVALDSQISRFKSQLGGRGLAIRKRTASFYRPLPPPASRYFAQPGIRSGLLPFDPVRYGPHHLIVDFRKAVG
jgi:hypothetical protein